MKPEELFVEVARLQRENNLLREVLRDPKLAKKTDGERQLLDTLAALAGDSLTVLTHHIHQSSQTVEPGSYAHTSWTIHDLGLITEIVIHDPFPTTIDLNNRILIADCSEALRLPCSVIVRPGDLLISKVLNQTAQPVTIREPTCYGFTLDTR